jgi:hypothetical protein
MCVFVSSRARSGAERSVGEGDRDPLRRAAALRGESGGGGADIE